MNVSLKSDCFYAVCGGLNKRIKRMWCFGPVNDASRGAVRP